MNMSNRVDFMRGLDRATGPGARKGRARRPGAQQGQMQSQPFQPQQPLAGQGPVSAFAVTPSAYHVDGTAPGVPNLGRMFTESLQPQIRSMIPVDQMGTQYQVQPQFGMNTQGY